MRLISCRSRSKSALPPKAIAFRAVLLIEELESRRLLAAAIASTVHPLLTVIPMAGGTPTNSGYTPAQIRAAYGITGLTFNNGTVLADGTGQTIAIVTAFDDPTIEADLAVFNKAYGLPAPPSFKKIVPAGTPKDAGWSLEAALDVEWAHAIAPKANILLVEAASDNTDDMMAAVDTARKQPGVVVVSMSWGGSEFRGESSYNTYFATPAGHIGGSGLAGGVTFVTASGDDGAGAEWPSSSPYVMSVGGTALAIAAAGGYGSEGGWNGSGGGYSTYEKQPTFQSRVQSTGARAIPDVAYVASPSTGVAVYATGYGWTRLGGTSAGAPQWSGLLALVNQGRALAGKGSIANAQAAVYTLPAADFHDITTGSNGYSAKAGYDLVTGLGSPRADLVVPGLVQAASVTTITTTGGTGTGGGTGSGSSGGSGGGGSGGGGFGGGGHGGRGGGGGWWGGWWGGRRAIIVSTPDAPNATIDARRFVSQAGASTLTVAVTASNNLLATSSPSQIALGVSSTSQRVPLNRAHSTFSNAESESTFMVNRGGTIQDEDRHQESAPGSSAAPTRIDGDSDGQPADQSRTRGDSAISADPMVTAWMFRQPAFAIPATAAVMAASIEPAPAASDLASFVDGADQAVVALALALVLPRPGSCDADERRTGRVSRYCPR